VANGGTRLSKHLRCTAPHQQSDAHKITLVHCVSGAAGTGVYTRGMCTLPLLPGMNRGTTPLELGPLEGALVQLAIADTACTARVPTSSNSCCFDDHQ
jgi:hypothetical protein